MLQLTGTITRPKGLLGTDVQLVQRGRPCYVQHNPLRLPSGVARQTKREIVILSVLAHRRVTFDMDEPTACFNGVARSRNDGVMLDPFFIPSCCFIMVVVKEHLQSGF